MNGIEKARQLLHLSKEYVKKVTGYESGVPTNEQLASLCVLFGLSKEELLKEYVPYSLDEAEIEHLKNFKKMMLAAGR